MEDTMKKVASVILVTILTLGFVLIGFRVITRSDQNQEVKKPSSATSTTITITANEWTGVVVDERQFESDIPEVNGVADKHLHYLMVVNDVHAKPREMADGVYVDMEKHIKVIYFKLIPNQGVSSATIDFRFK